MQTGLIHIFGASGSGTTTLGAALAAHLDVPHLDADDFYWRKTNPPYRVKVPPRERVDTILERVHGVPRVVLSGSLCSWGDRLLKLFEAAFLVRLDPQIRIARLCARERERYGQRIDPGGDRHEEHLAFVEWALQYDEGKAPLRTLHLHQRWMKRLRCPTFELNSVQPTARLVQEVSEKLLKSGRSLRQSPD